MNSSYLLNLILVSIPILICFDRRIQVLKDWKAIVAAIGVSGNLAFLFKTGLVRFQLVQYSVTSEAGRNTLPLEAVLFCFTVPFAGLFIYKFLNVAFPKNELEKYSLAFSNIIMGLSVAVIFFAYTKAYPVITFSLLFIFLLYIEYKNKHRFMYKFYRTYGVCILGYALCQLLFTGSNAAVYKTAHTLKFDLIRVPFENYFLLGVLLLMVIYLYEAFKGTKNAS